MSGVKQTAETAAQVTFPVPVGISGLTFIGITIKDWVLMGTAVLLVFQLIVITPKVFRILREAKRKTKRTIKETVNGKS